MSHVLYPSKGPAYEALKANFMLNAIGSSFTKEQLDEAFRSLLSTQSHHINSTLSYGIANSHHRVESIRVVETNDAIDAVVYGNDRTRGKTLTFRYDDIRVAVVSNVYHYEDCFASGTPFPSEWDPAMFHEVFTIYVKPATL